MSMNVLAVLRHKIAPITKSKTMRDQNLLMTRMDAIQDIRLGRGIQLTHTGLYTTFTVILRRDILRRGVKAALECNKMRKTYYLKLTPKQVLSYIRRHYPRSIT